MRAYSAMYETWACFTIFALIWYTCPTIYYYTSIYWRKGHRKFVIFVWLKSNHCYRKSLSVGKWLALNRFSAVGNPVVKIALHDFWVNYNPICRVRRNPHPWGISPSMPPCKVTLCTPPIHNVSIRDDITRVSILQFYMRKKQVFRQCAHGGLTLRGLIGVWFLFGERSRRYTVNFAPVSGVN